MNITPNQQGIIGWFASNPVAANLLMLCIIALGLMSFSDLRKEAFPMRETDTISISITYNSGDAKLSEEGIAVKIEEALATVQGIKRITSTSNSSGSTVSVEKQSGYDIDLLLSDIKNKVDAIYSFPSGAENAVIAKDTRLGHAYSVKLSGDTDHATLQTLAQLLKVDLLAQSEISNLTINTETDPMISVEVDEAKLQTYGITLSDITAAINAESSISVTSSLRNSDKVVRLKAAQQAYRVGEFANIPLITTSTGNIIRLGDVAKISDVFDETSFVLSRYNGQPGIGLEIKVDEQGDVLRIVEQAQQVVETWKNNNRLPQNVTIEGWYDGGELIRDRLSLLVSNALSGIALVFVLLALFLNMRVAIWVTAGLPFIFCGTLFFMTDDFAGMTINEMTTFGFILALGIVVDDAVVVGESVYETRSREGDTLASTVKGTRKVAVPTIFGVLTTVATFAALSNVEGGMGHVYSQFAVIVAICLLLSVVESKLILPAHLAHLNTHRKQADGWRATWSRIQNKADGLLQNFNQKIYRPTILVSLKYRYAMILGFVALFILIIGMPLNGAVRVAFFPGIPGSVVQGSFTMQNDASFGQTEKNLLFMEQQARLVDEQLRQQYQHNESALGTLEVIASSDLKGAITIELSDDSPYSLDEFVGQWKALIGTPEGIKTLDIRSRFGSSSNFKVELSGWNNDTLTQAGSRFRAALETIAGVSGIDDNFNSGQAQLQFELTEQGYALGMTTAQLSQQLLQAFGGDVVQRYQRGKDEVKVRVRYPESARQNVADVLNARIRTPDGTIVPLSAVARATSGFQENSITRIGGLRAIYVSASVDKDVLSSNELVALMQRDVVPELEALYPDLTIHFAGEAEQQQETSDSMTQLFIIAMMAIYVLLAVPLRSYVQPVLIMTAIPFGLVGAIIGHWLNDMTLSILSFNGIIALSGVVVNDSLMLVSRYNELIKEGIDARKAIINACTERLRPVLLTSLTTYAGLMPLLSETSAQAQFIIPAAASLGYGILFSTLITLVLIPALLMMQEDVRRFWLNMKAPQHNNTDTPTHGNTTC